MCWEIRLTRSLANKTNAAKSTTATFATDGVYNFRVIVKDASGFAVTSDVSVTVVQTFSGLTVQPNTGPVYIAAGTTQKFTVMSLDQFGGVISTISPTVTWTIDSGGVGSIDSSGVYTVPDILCRIWRPDPPLPDRSAVHQLLHASVYFPEARTSVLPGWPVPYRITAPPVLILSVAAALTSGLPTINSATSMCPLPAMRQLPRCC